VSSVYKRANIFKYISNCASSSLVWYKLLLNKINGKMNNFIVNMYNSIKSCIVYNDNKSDFFSSEVGVRQNEHLFPFLFAVFLNDLIATYTTMLSSKYCRMLFRSLRMRSTFPFFLFYYLKKGMNTIYTI
jgi:hypothetical protein